MSPTDRRSRRSFGKIRRLPSGNYQASYVGPDSIRHTGPETYTARGDAEGWLRDERRLIEWNDWSPPDSRRATTDVDMVTEPRASTATVLLGSYARDWIERRVTSKGAPLHPRTRLEYLGYLDGILKTLAEVPIESISPADVARWHATNAKTAALRHKAYNFVKSVFRTAVEVDELIERNPCRVDNAGRKPRPLANPARVVRGLSHETVRQLADLVQPRDKALILLLAYCCVRTGEACALRRSDLQLGVDAAATPFGWLTVERGVSSYGGQRHEGDTKTGAKGERVVPIPPHIVGELASHLERWAAPGPSGLLFPSTNPDINFRTTQQINGHAAVLRPDGTVRKKGYGWYHARQAAGVPTMHLHWLRHWSSTLWDEAGTPEGMRRAIMGHVQQGMTGHYTHPDTTRASAFARRVSELAGWSAGNKASQPHEAAGTDSLVSTLAGLDPRVLGDVLRSMTRAQVIAVLPQLPAELLAATLVAPGPSTLSYDS